MSDRTLASTIPTVVLDFECDWRVMVCAKLTGMGYIASPTESTDELGIAYFNALRRRIEAQPRTVRLAAGFSCPQGLTDGLGVLRAPVERGDDLTPFMSRGLRDRDYDDGLLNDWGIFHFHLGTHVEADGFVARTKHVLFAVVGMRDFHMLGCRLHGPGAPQQPWSEQALLEIIHRNWPNLIRHARRNDIVDIHPDDVLTDSEVANFRRAGIQAIFKMPDGTIYFPPGGGITTARTSAAVVEQLDQTIAQLHDLARLIRDNVGALIREASNYGIELGPEIRMHLTWDACNHLCVIDEATGFRSRLLFDSEFPPAEPAS